MDGSGVERVRLTPWSEGDFWLLRRANSPEMTEHLGGPESEEKLADRQRRYVEPFAGCMYRVALADTGESVGSIGYWEREWRGGTVWETGWGILPEFQGRGLAAQAARALVDVVRQAGGHGALHAFPAVDHPASNGVCRRAGFTLLGQADFEYPKGNWIRSNDWCVDLGDGSANGSRTGSATGWHERSGRRFRTTGCRDEPRSVPAMSAR